MKPIESKFSSAFDSPPESREAARRWTQEVLIPEFCKVDKIDIEGSLLAIHHAATQGVLAKTNQAPPDLSDYTTALVLSDRYSGYGIKDIQDRAKLILQKKSQLHIQFPQGGRRGRYRVFAEIYEKAGKDMIFYQHIYEPIHMLLHGPGVKSFVYEPPYKGLGILMRGLCDVFKKLEESDTNNPVNLALRVAFFYAVGNKLVHPFYDGHHRTFDLFSELCYQRAGVNLVLPRDNQGNVPESHPLRIAIGKVMPNFLVNYSIPVMDASKFGRMFGNYQEYLLTSLADIIDNPFGSSPGLVYSYLCIAEEMLKLSDKSQFSKEIAELRIGIKEKAQKSTTSSKPLT